MNLIRSLIRMLKMGSFYSAQDKNRESLNFPCGMHKNFLITKKLFRFSIRKYPGIHLDSKATLVLDWKAKDFLVFSVLR